MKTLPSRRYSLGLSLAALAAGGLLGCASRTTAPFEPSPEASVEPRINESFLDFELNVAELVERFEGESREVLAHREEIVGAIGLERELGFDFVAAIDVEGLEENWAARYRKR